MQASFQASSLFVASLCWLWVWIESLQTKPTAAMANKMVTPVVYSAQVKVVLMLWSRF